MSIFVMVIIAFGRHLKREGLAVLEHGATVKAETGNAQKNRLRTAAALAVTPGWGTASRWVSAVSNCWS
jgi:hypothetical protein